MNHPILVLSEMPSVYIAKRPKKVERVHLGQADGHTQHRKGAQSQRREKRGRAAGCGDDIILIETPEAIADILERLLWALKAE